MINSIEILMFSLVPQKVLQILKVVFDLHLQQQPVQEFVAIIPTNVVEEVPLILVPVLGIELLILD